MINSSNFRAKQINKPLFRFIPRLTILPELLITPAEKKIVFDPIGNQPYLIADLLAENATVVADPVNPVDEVVLSCLIDPPAADIPNQIRNAFYDQRYADQRLEQYLKGLYRTTCSECGKEVQARFFIHETGSDELLEKIYTCSCGVGGAHPANKQDKAMSAEWRRSDGMYRSKIAQSFHGVSNVDRQDVLDVLSVYTPRALFALDLIVHKIKPTLNEDARRYFDLVLLYIADSVASLWNIKDRKDLPLQIYTPKVRMEFNIWLAVEEALALLEELAKSNDGANGKLLIGSPGIHGAPTPTAISAVVPRPNQAYWALSALWTRWLLNRPTDEPFLRTIIRKKLDWDWFYDASTAMLRRISENAKKIPIHFVLLDKEPEYTATFMFALNNAFYELKNFAIQPATETLLLRCTLGRRISVFTIDEVQRSKPDHLRVTLRETLERKKEPVPYEYLLMELLCDFSQDPKYVFGKKQFKAFIRSLNEALQSGDYEDVEKRNTPETGTWKIKSSDQQQTLL